MPTNDSTNALLENSGDTQELLEGTRGVGTGGELEPAHFLSGDRRVRRELRQTLKRCGLPIKGDLFDHVYAYIRENY